MAVTDKKETLDLLKEHKGQLEHFGVRKIGVFGSIARDEATPESDVDVIVEFAEGEKTFDNYMNLKFYLEDLFGRSVDIVTPKSLKPALKEIVLQSVIYAA